MPEIDDASAPDPTQRDLRALFAVALADEPESRVTADSVLREVRRIPASGGFAEWLRTAGWKWGGGLVAAAALVGAVAVLPPMTGGGSADSMTMADAGAPDMDRAYSAAEGSDDAGTAADRDESAADSAAAGAMADMPAEEADTPQAESDTADDTAAAPSRIAAADSAADGTAGDSAADGGESIDIVHPALTDAEWAAAIDALPAGAVGQRWDQGLRDAGGPVSGSVRIDTIGLTEADRYLVVVAGPDTGPGRDYPGGTDPATVGDLAERYRHIGMTVVQAFDGADRVAVAATGQALRLVSRADLTRIAEAVLGAS